MRLPLALAVALLPVLLVPLTSSPAQTPPEEEEVGELTTSARPDTITYGEPTTITGRLTTSVRTPNVPVLLEAKEAPFGGRFSVLETTTTNSKGTYRFKN